MLATINNPNWYMDIRAINHLTTDLNKLTLKMGYKGKEKLLVGNGNSLKIFHIGSSIISFSFLSQPLYLNDILYVPNYKKFIKHI